MLFFYIVLLVVIMVVGVASWGLNALPRQVEQIPLHHWWDRSLNWTPVAYTVWVRKPNARLAGSHERERQFVVYCKKVASRCWGRDFDSCIFTVCLCEVSWVCVNMFVPVLHVYTVGIIRVMYDCGAKYLLSYVSRQTSRYTIVPKTRFGLITDSLLQCLKCLHEFSQMLSQNS